MFLVRRCCQQRKQMWYACSIARNYWLEPPPITEPLELAGGVYIEPILGWVKNADADL